MFHPTMCNKIYAFVGVTKANGLMMSTGKSFFYNNKGPAATHILNWAVELGFIQQDNGELSKPSDKREAIPTRGDPEEPSTSTSPTIMPPIPRNGSLPVTKKPEDQEMQKRAQTEIENPKPPKRNRVATTKKDP